MSSPNIVTAQKVPKSKEQEEDILALFCYYFPQYKYHEAKELPYRRVVAMLNTAIKEKTKMYYEFVQIVAAPHTKRGAGVKKLLDQYKKLIG